MLFENFNIRINFRLLPVFEKWNIDEIVSIIYYNYDKRVCKKHENCEK